ncbi:hypothetical protein LVJ82_06315 [Vitreoscilla massiliensis]|uniref:Uncharacterized protein n=1 Tax=Vitreoscilla massiliensis TaxID=1689272 RepID=A0ABY4E6R7_9NEIS|nr:hypothetical protein [Vitreoscilla massiliensis]UOO90585.1 hypothetical protein LVJ82_06315 [Vitreoscilla massiliensis]
MNKKIIFLLFTCIFIALTYQLTYDVCNYFAIIPGFNCNQYPLTYEYYIYGLIAFIPAFFVPFEGKKPSTIFINILYFFHVIPSILLIPKAIQGYVLESIVWGLTISVLFTLIVILSKGIHFKLPKIKNQLGLFIIFVLAMVAIAFSVIIVSRHGFKFEIPNITDVYGLREEFKENSDAITLYATLLGGYFISPILILIAINRKFDLLSKILVVISLLLIFIIFSSSGIKSIAFSSIVTIFFYFLIKKIKNFGLSLIIFITTVIGFAFTLFKLTPIDLVYIHWLRRIQVVPGLNTSRFYEYFILKSDTLAESTYSAPKLISQYYYGTSGSANAGIFGDAVGRFGLIGLLINSILLLLILIVLNAITNKNNTNILAAMMILIGYAACNSSLLTVLLSYGLGPTILTVYLLQNTQFIKDKKWSNE